MKVAKQLTNLTRGIKIYKRLQCNTYWYLKTALFSSNIN